MPKSFACLSAAKVHKSLAAIIFIVGIALHATFYASPANSDMASGRHALHMDEWIIYDQMKPFVEARSPSDAYRAYIGTDFRYGRLMYLFAAPSAIIGEKLYGERGLIIGVRMFFYLAIIALAAMTFIIGGRSLLAALGGVSLLILPFSDYYATTPKPDVLQVISLIGVFILLAKEKRLWAFFVFGAAVGFKLSSLIALPIVGFALAQRLPELAQQTAANWRAVVAKIGAFVALFIAGLASNVPIILTQTNGWQSYQSWTLGQLSHGQNRDEFLFWEWMSEMPALTDGTLNTFILAGLMLASLIIALFPQIKAAVRAYQKVAHDPADKLKSAGMALLTHHMHSAALLGALAVAWILAITLFTPRIWGFYLWPAFALSIVAVVYWQASLSGKATALFKVLLAISFVALITNYYESNRSKHYERMSQRTQSPAYLDLERKHEHVLRFLASQTSKTQQLIHFDPRLFQPTSTPSYKIVNYWGPYKDWDKRPLAIIAIDDSFKLFSNPKTAGERTMNEVYPLSLKHRVQPHGNCQGAGCYHLALRKDGLEIWVRN